MVTHVIQIDQEKPLDEQLADAAALLRDGALVAFPTETVYGLGGCAYNTDAAVKIYTAKGRPSDNPLIVHVASPEEADRYAYTSDLYFRLAAAFMPGPLTVILPRRDCIPLSVTGGLDTVGIRCPSNPIARTLIRLAGVPVAAPSANLSGRPSPTTAAHVYDDLHDRIDVLIDGGPCEIGLESTVIQVKNHEITVLRPGAVTPEMLSKIGVPVHIDHGVTEKLPDGTIPLAPGMKYRHYAPRAKVYLLRDGGNGDFDNRAITFLQAKLSKNPSIGILCFDEYSKLLQGKNVFSFGVKTDDMEHSRRLFDCLRRFDDTDADEIYAMASDTAGIGLALFNRMLKAAGYTVLDL